MKKILLSLTCLLALTTTASEILSNSEVAQQWRTKAIPVNLAGHCLGKALTSSSMSTTIFPM